MIFSKGTGYALRALIFLAERMDDGPFHASMISESIGVQRPILAKTMNRLASMRLVKSVSGPKGGFWLARSPEKIALLEIHDAFEPSRSFHECLLGHDECPGKKYCSLHKKWLEPQRKIDRFLRDTTLASITPLEFGLISDEIDKNDQ